MNEFQNDPMTAMVYAIERMRDAGKKLFGRKLDDGESVLRVANSYLMSLDPDPEKIDARAIVLTADQHFCSWKHEGDFPDASEFAREYRRHFKAMYEWRQLPGVDAHGSPLCIRVDSSLPESEKQKIVAQSALEIGMSVPQKQLPRPPEERVLDRELIRLGSKLTGGSLEEKRAEIERLNDEREAQIAALRARVGGETE